MNRLSLFCALSCVYLHALPNACASSSQGDFSMSYLSNTITSIKPSPTLTVAAKATEMKNNGQHVIILAAGEPDFHTPSHIKEAAIEAIRENFTRYTAVGGIPALKTAIQKKFKEDNGISYDVSEIIVGNGGKQVIYNAFMATCNAGDEVLIPAPFWVSYPDMAALAGASPRFVQGDDAFKLTPERLKSALTARTKWLILNSPSNPTGAVYSHSELQALGAVLKDHHCLILSDDIYEYLTFEGTFSNIVMACPELKERTLVVNGVSKSYAMTGWRIGYGAGPKEIIGAMQVLQSQSTSNPCSIAQKAALAALNSPRDFLPAWCTSFTERRDFVLERLQTMKGLSCQGAGGAFYLFINCTHLLGQTTPFGTTLENDMDVAAYLLEKGGVAVVPGSAFGLDGHFRISYACSKNELEDALNRIETSLGALTHSSKL